MAAPRNFDTDVARYVKELPEEGPPFDLGGETFHTLALPPGGVMSRLTGTGTNVATFIEDCLITNRLIAQATGIEGEDVTEPADDKQRWRALMADDERPVPVEVLTDIVIWLAKEYGERPTVRSRR